MGLYMEMMWPFMGWSFVMCVVGVAVMFLINKLFMYNGPEDEEVWELGKEHFMMVSPENESKQL